MFNILLKLTKCDSFGKFRVSCYLQIDIFIDMLKNFGNYFRNMFKESNGSDRLV